MVPSDRCDAVVVTRSVDLAAPPDRVWPLLSDTDRFNRARSGWHAVTLPRHRGGTTRSRARFVGRDARRRLQAHLRRVPLRVEPPAHLRRAQAHARGPGGVVHVARARSSRHAPARGTGASKGGRGRRCASRSSRARWAAATHRVAQREALRGEASPSSVDSSTRTSSRGRRARTSSPVVAVGPARIEAAIARLRDERGRRAAGGAAAARSCGAAPTPTSCACGPSRWPTSGARTGARCCAPSCARCRPACSSCAGASCARAASRRRSRSRALEDITPEGHCQLCDITFDLDLDRAVEATFLPHPAVRRVPEALFCMGGPGADAARARAGERRAERHARRSTCPAEPGRYRLFARGGATATLEVDAAGAARVEATLEPDGIRAAAPARRARGRARDHEPRWRTPAT